MIMRNDFTDYGGGGFPVLTLHQNSESSLLLPMFLYFTGEGVDEKGCIRKMGCQNVICTSFDVVDLICGNKGFGRDVSIAFHRQGHIAAVSFLDLDGEDALNSMQMRLALFNITHHSTYNST